MTINARVDKVDNAYNFLAQRAQDGRPFTRQELEKASGWRKSSVDTNLSKKLKGLIRRSGKQLSVDPSFQSMTKESFRRLMSQKTRAFASYARSAFSHVVTFEFLLPLTQQDRLRDALDALFYKDTLEARIGEIGLKALEKLVPRPHGSNDPQFTTTIINQIGDLFGGYSIGHVAGRFRAAPLMARSAAWQHRYVVDESTAVVRFIVPCKSARTTFRDDEDVTQVVEDAAKKNATAAAGDVPNAVETRSGGRVNHYAAFRC